MKSKSWVKDELNVKNQLEQELYNEIIWEEIESIVNDIKTRLEIYESFRFVGVQLEFQGQI